MVFRSLFSYCLVLVPTRTNVQYRKNEEVFLRNDYATEETLSHRASIANSAFCFLFIVKSKWPATFIFAAQLLPPGQPTLNNLLNSILRGAPAHSSLLNMLFNNLLA